MASAALRGDPSRGRRILRTLDQIEATDASSVIRDLYDDVRRVSRVPFTSALIRSLANWPDFLVRAWRIARPYVGSPRFEHAADVLRAEALMPHVRHVGRVPSFHGLDDALAFTDSVHYVMPKVLLEATFFDELLLRSETPPEGEHRPRRSLPAGPAPGTVRLARLHHDAVEARARHLFGEIQGLHRHPFVAGYYRAIARWPPMLEWAWNNVEPHIGTRPYRDRRVWLADTARRAVRAWNPPGFPNAKFGLDRQEERRVIDVVAFFRQKMVPDTVLDVTLVQQALGGIEAAAVSRFSTERSRPHARVSVKRLATTGARAARQR